MPEENTTLRFIQPEIIPREISPTVNPTPEEIAQSQVEYWTRELDREIREYKRWKLKTRLRRFGWIAFLIAMIFTLHKHAGNLWWLWFVWGGSAAADTASGNGRKAASELMNTSDPRAAGVLAIACRDADRDTQNLASIGLKTLLPKLKSSDSEFIDDRGMEALIALLSRNDAALILSALTALQQVGDERAVPAVLRLSHADADISTMKGYWGDLMFEWTGRDRTNWEEVRRAAEECLPYLERNAERKKASSTLLRPAAGGPTSDMALLRPAGATNAEPQDQLLRPAEPGPAS